jgi:hypothetical protein
LEVNLSQSRLQADPSQAYNEYLGQLLALNVKEKTLREVQDKLDELETGSDPNKKGDFLGADDLPPFTLTRELEDL